MFAEYFFIAVILFYLLIHLILYFGYRRSLSLTPCPASEYPAVSVIVAAKNESMNIERCIESLRNLDYPEELLEIILVDDNSGDNTYELMQKATAGKSTFKIIRPAAASGSLKGKANAIHSAIGICRGKIIISTDADCVVPTQWVKSTVSYYRQDTAMVCGFTSIKQMGLFSILQNIDWMYLLTLASASAGLKMILSCLGNNLSFTKESYKNSGGYENMNFSVTEDLALMRKIDSMKDYEIRFPADRNCLAETLPCMSVSELFSQKRRWFRGGIGINMLGYILGFELYLTNFMLLFGLFLINAKLYCILIIVKTLSEIILISKTFSRFEMRSLYKFYPLFIIYFALYGLTLPFSFLFGRKINWKGQKF